jgi:hypothetical protein
MLSSEPAIPNKIRNVAILLLVAFAIFALDWKVNGKKAAEQQAKIRIELRDISPFSGSIQLSDDSSYKTVAGVVSQTYSADASMEAVTSWYLNELKRQGWALTTTERNGDKALLRFCRNKEGAEVRVERYQNGLPHNALLKVSLQLGWGGPFKC